MTAHSSGTGTSWNETLDVDQPHGLDYQEWNDIRIGIRKRESQEHATYADSTVGGIHKPGGAAVLGIDDDTATVIADGTYRGHGLVWDGSVNLWCWTKTAGATATPGVGGTEDWTILKMHPDKQWGGQDITWAGAHEFDASVDITGPLNVDGSSDFSDVAITGDLTIAGKFVIDGSADFSDVFIEGDVSIDGTAVFQNTVLVGDSTFTFDSIAGETGPIFKIFGDWSTRAIDTTYTARTDGIVTARASKSTNTLFRISGETPAGTKRQTNGCRVDTGGSATAEVGVAIPVKAGDTWAITGVDSTTYTNSGVFWLPLGDNT